MQSPRAARNTVGRTAFSRAMGATWIRLSSLVSIGVPHSLHQTLKVMRLGGLAWAVGILVDDAPVEIENDYRHRELGKPLREASLDAAAEVAPPAFVSTLS